MISDNNIHGNYNLRVKINDNCIAFPYVVENFLFLHFQALAHYIDFIEVLLDFMGSIEFEIEVLKFLST